MNRTRFFPCLACLLFALALTALPSVARAADVVERKGDEVVYIIGMADDQKFTIDDKTYPIEQLARRLKSAGAKPANEIRVQVPQTTEIATLKKISAAMMASGYTKFVFVKPRHAESIPGK